MHPVIKISTSIIILTTAIISSAAEPAKKKPSIKELRDAVSYNLKDPSSSQFRSEIFHGNSLCGEINTKNSYGAYIGFKRFIATKDLSVLATSNAAAVIEGSGFVYGTESDISASLIQVEALSQVMDEQEALIKKSTPKNQLWLSDKEKEKRQEEVFFIRLWDKYCSKKK